VVLRVIGGQFEPVVDGFCNDQFLGGAHGLECPWGHPEGLVTVAACVAPI
jgi:hypothetical protein